MPGERSVAAFSLAHVAHLRFYTRGPPFTVRGPQTPDSPWLRPLAIMASCAAFRTDTHRPTMLVALATHWLDLGAVGRCLMLARVDPHLFLAAQEGLRLAVRELAIAQFFAWPLLHPRDGSSSEPE